MPSSSSSASQHQQQQQTQQQQTHKIILVGSSGVGKSSILLRFTNQQHSDSTDTNTQQQIHQIPTTIGVDFRIKYIKHPHNNNNNHTTTPPPPPPPPIKLQIWDTAGQERYRTLQHSYYRNCSGVVLVYDMSSEQSFDDIVQYWYPCEVLQFTSSTTTHQQPVVVLLVGNKSDLVPHSHHLKQKVHEWCVSQQTNTNTNNHPIIIHMECSAYMDEQSVQCVFMEMVHQILLLQQQQQQQQSQQQQQQDSSSNNNTISLGGGGAQDDDQQQQSSSVGLLPPWCCS